MQETGDGLLLYERADEQERIWIAVNREVHETIVRLPFHAAEELLTEKQYAGLPTDEFVVRIPPQTAMILRAIP